MKKIIGLLFIIAATLSAQALSIQGVLRNTDGSTVADGSRSFMFLLYANATGGSAVWCETQTLAVTNGVYSATLGDANNGSCANISLSALSFGVPYFLGIAIDGAAELYPRTKLTLTPYAILAQVDGQTNIFPQSGNVGIGVTAPTAKLQVAGSAIIAGSANISGTTTMDTASVGSVFSVAGTSNFNNSMTVTKNASTLNMVGTDHSYISWYPDGVSAGRKGWIGWGSAETNDLFITNDINGGKVVLYAGATYPGATGDIDMIANSVNLGNTNIVTNGNNNWRLIEFNNFDNGGEGWYSQTNAAAGTYDCAGNLIVGRMGVGASVWKQFNPPAGTRYIKIEFEAYVLDSWDAEFFYVRAEQNFKSNIMCYQSPQFHSNYGHHLCSSGSYYDRIQPVTVFGEWDGEGSILIRIVPVIDSGNTDESLGIDNVAFYVR